MIYKHVIIGKYHMTYQGIGHQHNHKSHHDPDCMCFRCVPSPLIGTWKTVGTINKSTSKQTSHKTLEHSSVTYLLPVFVPALKYGLPV